MDGSLNFQAEVRQLLRDRILDTAVAITAHKGWGALTMADVAAQSGISRQTLYKEVGAKRALGEAMVARETDRFTDAAATAFRAHPGSFADGVGAAALATLQAGAGNPLVTAIAAGSASGDTELLPLLATQTGPVLPRALAAIADAAAATYPAHADAMPEAVEVMVRLALSHLLAPLGTPERAARQIRSVAARLLGAEGP